MFNLDSYEKHSQWYNQKFPTEESKSTYLKNHLNTKQLTIGKWLQEIFFKSLNPLLADKNGTWLTLGDAYGFDAQYILQSGNKAIASDLNTDFLTIAKNQQVITDFSLQNAEAMSYPNHAFDYILCKESYHHFPRPYAALYEMARVAKKGFILMEPQDPVLKMPFLLGLMNVISAFSDQLSQKLWKNRFSYEPVGNFIYKIAERELEKFAAGLNLPMVAFKKLNPNFYFEGANETLFNKRSFKFLSIYFKKRIRDFLSKTGIIPAQVLCAIIFKTEPNESTLKHLQRTGYRIIKIPSNPYQ
ncbi:class I SAM-dependent methyltransferase [Pedobacter chitinilyticus]|uniref:Class I SAM-dependent methyltransferase n=1 Tax=Pedobacter chitinilyticus TaxID=2233776 RepID=A0A443YUB3_9SPHI|nr:class I SAM-dependent methyltransferase [Pedobacter chitinilyticus]RWU07458.1 class I SAM-dependent methyltransferase [Pedobacter chitinilyticus]